MRDTKTEQLRASTLQTEDLASITGLSASTIKQGARGLHKLLKYNLIPFEDWNKSDSIEDFDISQSTHGVVIPKGQMHKYRFFHTAVKYTCEVMGIKPRKDLYQAFLKELETKVKATKELYSNLTRYWHNFL